MLSNASLSSTKKDLEEMTETYSQGSPELLTPTRVSNKNEDDSKPKKKSRRDSETVPETEDVEVEEDDKIPEITRLLEHCEGAMVCASALQDQLNQLYEVIATADELDKWPEMLKKKVRDVLRVSKKGVALKKVTEFRIVES